MARRRQNDYLRDAPDEFIECRSIGHAWEDVGDYLNGQHVDLVLQCQRCDSYAIIQWNKTAGTIDGRKHKYSEGYLNHSGERFSKADARLERIRRTSFQGGSKEFEALMSTIDEEMESYR